MVDFTFDSLASKAGELASGAMNLTGDAFGSILGTALDKVNVNTSITGQDLKAISATDNTNYVMRLYELGAGDGLEVCAPAPRTFKIGMENQWSDVLTMLRDSLGGGSNGLGSRGAAAFKFGQQYFGTYVLPQSATLQVWNGSPPMRFQIPMSFNAINDPLKEVIQPIHNLIMMAAPKRSENNFLRAPGPTLNEVIQAKGDLSKVKHLLGLRVGRNVNIRGLLIDSVDIEWENRTTKKGYPIAAEVVVGLRTYWTFAQKEYLDSFFGSVGG